MSSKSQRTTLEPEALDQVLERAFVHSHAEGIVCGNCGDHLHPSHQLSVCAGCGHRLGAVVVDGGADIQLMGRPTYYVEWPQQPATI